MTDICAQETLTAPSGHFKVEGKKKVVSEPTPSQPDPTDEEVVSLAEISSSLVRFEFVKVERNNTGNLPPGFYASFAPPTPDTIEVFEGGTSQVEVIKVGAGKEIIQGDSVGVIKDVRVRYSDYKTSTFSTPKGKTNSMVTRTGFIPGQGFGTNRYRFAVRPGKFALRRGAMVTASVHMTKEANNIGNVLCAVTGIDYEKNVFYVEASNEIPRGESINWVIVNYPDTL
ncbi:MAG TPA: hypothetical protein VIX80_07310 [Candidatus Kapabacteria bacterium]